jgi:hypothetical protein
MLLRELFAIFSHYVFSTFGLRDDTHIIYTHTNTSGGFSSEEREEDPP